MPGLHILGRIMFCVESCGILGYSHVYWVHFSLECIICSIVCKHYRILTYSMEISICYIILYTLDYIYPTTENPGCLISLHNYTKCIKSLAYLQYFFNWRSPFILNTQWQVVVSFNLHLLLVNKWCGSQFLIKTKWYFS